MTEKDDTDDPIELPVDGTLDLHTFRPREVKDLIPDYLESCRERGIDQVRIVHGKGTGALRRTVHSVLGRLPGVKEFRTAGPGGGGWGATIAILHPGVSRVSAEGGSAAVRTGKHKAIPPPRGQEDAE